MPFHIIFPSALAVPWTPHDFVLLHMTSSLVGKDLVLISEASPLIMNSTLDTHLSDVGLLAHLTPLKRSFGILPHPWPSLLKCTDYRTEY